VLQAYLDATSADTVRSRCYTGKPARMLRNTWTDAWADPSGPGPLGMPLQNILTSEANARIARSGRKDLQFAPVGQIVGRMNEVRSVRDVMYELVEEYIETVDRLEEGVQVLRLLMTQDDVSFDGRIFSLDGATMRPRPVQQPSIPVWIGGRGERRTIPIAARFADAWHAYGSIEDLRRLSAVLDRHAEAAGRDPASILRASDLSLSEPWDEVRARAGGLREVGFGYLTVGWPSEGQGRLEEFVSNVMPEIAA